jgi:hypothetical protein
VQLNKGFDAWVLSSSVSEASRTLLTSWGIRWSLFDGTGDFVDLEKRPYGRQYPIECFYTFAAYKQLPTYRSIVTIEPDVFTNRALDLDMSSIPYIAIATDEHTIRAFAPLMNDLPILQTAFRVTTEGHRARSGVRIYNVAGANERAFYETIVEVYKTSLRIGAPRCGDDTLFVLFQMMYPEIITRLPKRYNYIGDVSENPEEIVLYHEHTSRKWWNAAPCETPLGRHFQQAMLAYVKEIGYTAHESSPRAFAI